jgi:ERCC4-type nuclease
MTLLSVIVDSREPAWCQSLTFGGAPTSVGMLDAGDLLAICDDAVLTIERKEASDFLNTLRDGRLFPQFARMREVSPWAYLVLVGKIERNLDDTCTVAGRQTNWRWASVQGALLTAQEMGIAIVECVGDRDYEETILRLVNRDRSPMRIHPPRDAALVSDAEAILGALPGVGADRADTLVKYCGSPAWALAFLTEDGSLNDRVPGIGEGVKRRVRKALGLDDDQALSVILRATGNPTMNTKTLEAIA